MESTMKTISLRITSDTQNQIERIIQLLNEKEGKQFNTSEAIRYSVDSALNNLSSGSVNGDRFLDLMKDYIKTAYFKSYKPYTNVNSERLNKVNVQLLENILWNVEEMYDNYDYNEVRELGMLFNEDGKLSLAELIRFKYRLLPETFLNFMGVAKEEYLNLSDTDLAKLLTDKLMDSNFRSRAKMMFSINI